LKLQQFNILLRFLINLINDDAFVSDAATDVCSMVLFVCSLWKCTC